MMNFIEQRIEMIKKRRITLIKQILKENARIERL